jgi:hypothetical protein
VAQRLQLIAPKDPYALNSLPTIYLRLGRANEAMASVEKQRAASVNSLPERALLAQNLAIVGKRSEAETMAASLKEGAKTSAGAPLELMAELCFALGDNNQGFAYLEQAYQAHDARLAPLAVFSLMPVYDDVRKDARFVALLKKMGLPAPAGP